MDLEAAFQRSYQKLNHAQQQAVDTLDGPVLVVAGPGTGKTQLLSMRVANILRQADVSPHNILCMTFTEDAAHNMRERLAGIIGPAAYDVEIHTFHSFGASVIARHSDYFYQGIGAQPIDELASYDIYERIFQKLPQDNPLSTFFNGEFVFLKGAREAIDNFKTAGLDPDEIRAIAGSNLDFAATANPVLAHTMDGFTRIDKTSLERFQKLHQNLEKYEGVDAKDFPEFVKPLASIVIEALQTALEQCHSSGKTTSLTEFKNTFLTKDVAGSWQFKDTDTSRKLLALADVYEQYLTKLREVNLIDFNDMITRVVHGLETFTDLRLNLQEQYQYLLIDEFQDTSLSQLRLVAALTNNPVWEGRPNVLAVGDDDQAIYSFQGAELSNILNFHQQYRDVKVITLTENYRSRQAVLDAAKYIIEDSPERLVSQLEGITKDITAQNTTLPQAQLAHHRFASADMQRQWIAGDIKQHIDAGTEPRDIALIAAKHQSLRNIVPFLNAEGIPLSYDKREHILEVPAIAELVAMARLVEALAHNNHREADVLLPEILSFSFWGLSTKQIWHLYLENYRRRTPWLQSALECQDSGIVPIAEFFITLSTKAATTPLEHLMDWLIGNQPLTMQPANGEQLALAPTHFTSPFKTFYFGADARQENPESYLELLSHVRFLREKLREFRASEQLRLKDLVEYVQLVTHAGIRLVDSTPHREKTNAVSLYTAHAAKGLEFGTVYIIDANHDIWNSSGGGLHKVTMPSNLPIERRSGSEEEKRRLLFVAITRAKHHLVITGFEAAKRGNAPLKYLAGIPETTGLGIQAHQATSQTTAELTDQLNTSWQDRHLPSKIEPGLRELLLPQLERYRLSATHLQRFLNVADGGPAQWFLQCLLHFPQASTPNMAFGNAVHATLEAAQKAYRHTGERQPIENLLTDFSRILHQHRLEIEVEERLVQFGHKILRQYLSERYHTFKKEEYFEFDLSSRQVIINGVHLTGKIDRITPLGDHTVRVTDFKTGKPMYSWKASDPKRQIRLYHYKQQLTFYRLLLEESNALGPQTKVAETAIEFVQPDPDGRLVAPLTFMPTDDDVTRLRHIIKGAWQCMRTLELPQKQQYEDSLKGILQFEDELAQRG